MAKYYKRNRGGEEYWIDEEEKELEDQAMVNLFCILAPCVLGIALPIVMYNTENWVWDLVAIIVCIGLYWLIGVLNNTGKVNAICSIFAPFFCIYLANIEKDWDYSVFGMVIAIINAICFTFWRFSKS